MNDHTTRTTSPPVVSLGMPVYNGERFVEQAILSVIAQSLKSFELIICDNASTDGTEQICRALAASDPRVRYVRNEQNLGAHPNYNKTFSLARGRYFKWVAHDDALHPDYLERCVARLEAIPSWVLCQTDFEYIDESGATLGVEESAVAGSEAADPVRRFAALALQPHTCYDVMGVFRHSMLSRSMLLPSFHGADRALLAQLALMGPFGHIAEPLLRIRDHANRYTRARTRPAERAQWHDTRHSSRFSFPCWRLYATYWQTALRSDLTARQRLGLYLVLGKWWFVSWNAARMVVDVLAGVAPGIVGRAQQLKQRLFSPAPGIDRVRKSSAH